MSMVKDEIGVMRQLGNIIPTQGVHGAENRWLVYGDDTRVTPMLREQDWKPQKLPSYAPRAIKDQKQTNMVNGFAVTSAIEALRRKVGFHETELSAGYSYGNCNLDVEGPTNLEHVLAHTIVTGAVPTTLVPAETWQRQRWPAEVTQVASQYRVLGYWLCPTFEHMISAALSGFILIHGHWWGSADRLLRNGWFTPEPMGEISGAHTLVGFNPVYDDANRRWGLQALNSFGKQWGVLGYGIVPEDRFPAMESKEFLPYVGAWAVREVTAAVGDLQSLQEMNQAARV